jgi:acetyl esterase/lipase
MNTSGCNGLVFMKKMLLFNYLRFLLLAFPLGTAYSQSAEFPTAEGMRAGFQLRARYSMTPNVTYLTATSYEAKLDVYQRIDTDKPMPTLIFIHGGGWVGLNKEYAIGAFMPWVLMGWNVVNVEYRMARTALAPAAVEDCLCALRWTAAHAKEKHFDLSRLVIAGESAGGHLAMTTGMILESAGLDRECPGVPLPKVAAVISWFGVGDMEKLLHADDLPPGRDDAITWFGSMPNREEMARRVSPINYVRKDGPAVFLIAGDADPILSYKQSVEMHDALEKAGEPAAIHIVKGGVHGHFTPDQQIEIYGEILKFLKDHGIQTSP